MANRVTPLTQIELLSGNISAATYFDNNIGPAFSALNDASLGYVNYQGTDTGSANNYIISASFGTPSAYNAGMTVTFKPANTNTGASTITVSPLASASIQHGDGTACIGGEIQAGKVITLEYNGTAFVIIGPPFLYGTTLYYDYDDFLFCPGGAQLAGTSKLFNLTTTGNGTIVAGTPIQPGHPGFLNLTSGTTNFKFTGALASQWLYLDTFTTTIRAIIATNAIASSQILFGVTQAVSTTSNSTPAISFLGSSGSSFWQMFTCNGTASATGNTTALISASTWYDLMIVMTSSLATFFVNGSQVGTQSTNMPSSSTNMEIYCGCGTVSGANIGMNVDLIEILVSGIPVLSGSTLPRFLHGLV